MVNFNQEAANSLLNLDSTNAALAGAILELSSGLAVQFAYQGPAAWSISNFLQYQNAGDTQSVSNAQQGVSVLNIASGAINQIAGILDQMEQLATSSANAGAMTTVQMAANNTQFKALSNEINNIVANTKYGSKALLDGTYGSGGGGGGSVSAAGPVALPGSFKYAVTGATSTGSNWVMGSVHTALGGFVSNFRWNYTAPNASITPNQIVSHINAGHDTSGATALTASINGSGDLVLSATPPAGDKVKLNFSHPGNFAAQAYFPFAGGAGTMAPAAGSPEQFQVGYQSTNTLDVSIASVTASALGVSGANISTQAGASAAISAVQSALSVLSSVAAGVGASQDQLQALASDLQTMSTNVQAANSSVVDTNMASEMTAFSTQQILMQSGLAMLGQAQANPTLVLKLL